MKHGENEKLTITGTKLHMKGVKNIGCEIRKKYKKPLVTEQVVGKMLET